ncbi:MAG: LamG domain-containing protein [Candidatus Paceibacterota bacterium]
MKTSKQKSFTLIELLVVIVIISILSSIIIFSTGSTLEKQTKMEALNFSTSLKNKHAEFLISEWTFNGQTKAGQSAVNADVKDSWGYNNGSITGQVTVRDGEDCISGKCLEFDGGYMTAKTELTDDKAPISIELWLNIPSSFIWSNGTIGSLEASTGGIGIFRNTSNNVLTFVARIGSISMYGAQDYTIKRDRFYHLAFAGNGTTFNVYVDGRKINEILKGYGRKANESITGTFYLGHSKTYEESGGGYLKGIIDEVRLYNSALSSSEIKQNYIAGLDSLLANKAISKEEYHQRIFNLANHE